VDELLLDLYSYYASIGLGLPSPKIRAGAVGMLQSLLPQAEVIVASNLPLLENLTDGGGMWWELQVNLVSLCGSYLAIQKHKGRGTPLSSLPPPPLSPPLRRQVPAVLRCFVLEGLL
jgi:hypothetical protein